MPRGLNYGMSCAQHMLLWHVMAINHTLLYTIYDIPSHIVLHDGAIESAHGVEYNASDPT